MEIRDENGSPPVECVLVLCDAVSASQKVLLMLAAKLTPKCRGLDLGFKLAREDVG